MTPSLKDRIQQYKETTDYKLLPRLPIIVTINGRAFSKVTSLLEKPFSNEFSEAMVATALKLCYEVEGVILSYTFSDEIVLVIRNDLNVNTNPWYNNKIQKIASTTSSIATYFFNNIINATDLKTIGDVCFYSEVFCLPSVDEILNYLIFKQTQCYNQAINDACFYELLKQNVEISQVKNMTSGLSNEEKLDLLLEQLNVKFSNYNDYFKYGYICCKAPKISGTNLKYKWHINKKTPIFREDRSMISNIVNIGHDILRNE